MVQADASETCSQSESRDLWIMKCSKAAASPALFLQDGGVGKAVITHCKRLKSFPGPEGPAAAWAVTQNQLNEKGWWNAVSLFRTM